MLRIDRHQRADAVAARRMQHDHLAAVRAHQRIFRQIEVEFHHQGEAAAGKDLPAPVDHHCLGQVAQLDLAVQERVQAGQVEETAPVLIADLVGDRQRIVGDALLMLLQVGLRDVERAFHRRLDLVAEPDVEAVVQEGGREHRHGDGGNQRDQAEQQHQPGMQLRAHHAAAALDPQHDKAPRDDGAERQHDDEVGQQQPGDGARGILGLPDVGQDQIGHQARQGAQRQEDHGDAAFHVDPARPIEHAPAQAGLLVADGDFGHSAVPGRLARISSSRNFLRSVLRLRPSSSAALIWLPRVASRQMVSSGRSISCRMRS